MEWKVLKENSNYEVSEFGDVRTRKTGRIRKQATDKDGYSILQLWFEGQGKNCKAHRLVALNFLPPAAPNQTVVNHKDGNKQNNHYSNLEWATVQENTKHAADNGLLREQWGMNNFSSKLTPEIIDYIQTTYYNGYGIQRLANELNVSYATAFTWKKKYSKSS
jgi:NUMOD4 motif./HNH endonuclease.